MKTLRLRRRQSLAFYAIVGLLPLTARLAHSATEGATDASPADPVCHLTPIMPLITTYLEEFPTYFFKPLPTLASQHPPQGKHFLAGQWYGYSSLSNYLVNRDDPASRIRTPGNYDLVPTPEGEFVVVPTKSIPNLPGVSDVSPGVTFYRTADLMDAAPASLHPGSKDMNVTSLTAKFAYREETAVGTSPDTNQALDGTYVTLGALTGPTGFGNSRTYRAIGEKPQPDGNFPNFGYYPSSLEFRDFTAQFDPATRKLLSFGPKDNLPARPLCPGLKLKLPMLSKTGLYLSALDVPDTNTSTSTTSGTTKIFRVDASGGCKEVLDLGMKVGKVDFNYNDTRIAFHADSYTAARGLTNEWFSGVSRMVAKNVFVATLADAGGGNLKIADLRRITHALDHGTGSYYPTFLPDENLVMMSVQQTATAGTQGRIYRFDTVDASYAPYQQYIFNPAYVNSAKLSVNAAFALGTLYRSACVKDAAPLTAEELGAYALMIDPLKCAALVDRFWTAERADAIVASPELAQGQRFNAVAFGGISLDEQIKRLKNACPKAPTHTPMPAFKSAGLPAAILGTPLQIFTANCKGCHQGIETQVYRPDTGSLSFEVAPMIRYGELTGTPDAQKPAGAVKIRDLLSVLRKTDPVAHFPTLVDQVGNHGQVTRPADLLFEADRAKLEADLNRVDQLHNPH